jgi:hypothetical protein
MFTVSEIITAGSDLVGWRESANSLYPHLPANLKTSKSGYYVNDLPGIDFDIIIKGLSNDQTSASDYLTNVMQSEIAGIVSDFVNKSKSKLGSRAILTNFDVVEGIADVRDLVTKNARFVGWLISPRTSHNIKAEITKIGLQLNTAQHLTLYLYDTSKQNAVKTFDFDYTTPLSIQWLAVTDFLVQSEGHQQFILGYYEYDPNHIVAGQLTGSAVEFDFDCGCNNAPRRVFGEYVWIQPITFANADLNLSGSDYLLPSFHDLTSQYADEAFGMYAKLNVTCDITNLIVDNISVFAKAYQYKVAIRIMDDYMMSKRLNDTTDAKRYREQTDDMRNRYWSFLNGWLDSTGLKRRGIIEDISIDFSRMDEVCLPCEQDGIRIVQMGRR